MNDTKKLDSDDVLDYIGPMDPDMALTVDYLSGQATPEQIAEFERRFVEDEAFYMNVAPAIKVWNMPVSFRELMKRPPADLTAQRHARDLRNAAATTERTSAAPPTVVVAPFVSPATAAPRRSSVKRRRYRRAVNAINFGLKAVVAASLLLIAGIQAYIYFGMNRPNDVKVVQQAFERHEDAKAAAKASGPAAATVAPTFPRIPPRAGSSAIPAPGVSRLTPPPPVTAPPEADTSRTEAEVARSGIIALGTEVRTGDRETKIVELKDGTRVALRPNTAIRSTQGLSKGIGAPQYIYVEGEIAVEMPPEQPGTLSAMMIMSPAGNLMASGPGMLSLPGDSKVSTSFAVRCRPPNCAALEVAVAEGRVSIFRGYELTTRVEVSKGQFGLASGTELPTLVDSARAVGFPKPDPSIRKQP